MSRLRSDFLFSRVLQSEERVNNCNDVDVRLVSESCQYNRKTWLLDAEED